VVVCVVDADDNVWLMSKVVLPTREVIVDGHLVVAAALQDEHRFMQCRSGRAGVVITKIYPVRRRPAER